MRTLIVTAASAVVLFAAEAWAGCGADSDCGKGVSCRSGKCAGR